MEHAAIIEALGGPAKVAAALGCHRTRAARWPVEGIPFARYPDIVDLARKQGVAGITIEALYQGRTKLQASVAA